MNIQTKNLAHCKTLITLAAGLLTVTMNLSAQQSDGTLPPAPAPQTSAAQVDQLRLTVTELQTEVEMLKSQMKQVQAALIASQAPVASPRFGPAHTESDIESGGGAQSQAAEAQPDLTAKTANPASVSAEDRGILDYLKTTTVNVMIDGYYAYNFNDPIGRVNLLRAYDVSSNAFGLNQADVVFERAADPAEGRRFGTRLDVQFGQATATLQGNPANEPRPDIYRNIFQAFGTYVAPLGNNALTIDFGKWASSLGIEGNYTKDQINYSRSYWFNFLPFYHMGIRANYKLNDKLAANYWIVNGTNQVEPTNGFKDEMFGFVLTPNKKVTWTANYYLGQEHPDAVASTACGPVPVQPGLCFQPVTPAPDGKLHIIDSYLNWQATPKLTMAVEGDYVIDRLWANATPEHSSAPAHTTGGAAYVQYLFTPKYGIGARAEYLSDRGGLFSNVTEALKEVTLTYDFFPIDGFQLRAEWRSDWSNVPVFLTSTEHLYSKNQNTATLGVIWWFGRKQGGW
jgi:outer membrane murein-binding lipoprotein Lpp